MNTQNETVIILAMVFSVLFGSLTGGLTSYVVLHEDLFLPESPIEIEGLSTSEEATIAVVEQLMPAVVSIRVEQTYYPVGSGTGFFVSDDGLILTNRHVIGSGNNHYIVVMNDGSEHEAQVLARDVFLDLALLKIEGTGYPVVRLGDADAVRVGQTVIAIGNPLGEFPNSVTKGVVSGLNRTITAGSGFGDAEVIEQAIQTDAAINEGNSGGPLINLAGEVVGVNTAIAYNGQSLGFAIPVNAAKKIIEDVITYGRIVRPWLGVRYLMIDKGVKEEFGLSAQEGAYILPADPSREPSVIEGSPAANVGLLPGDIILQVQDIVLSGEVTLGETINEFEPGETIVLTILRGEEMLELSVTLEELDPTLFE